jgi:hypothetical protein
MGDVRSVMAENGGKGEMMIVLILGLVGCAGMCSCFSSMYYAYSTGMLGSFTGTADTSTTGVCAADKVVGYEYGLRTENPETKIWACPAGWEENYCNWVDGAEIGKLQCRRLVGGSAAALASGSAAVDQTLAKPCEHKTPDPKYKYKRRIQRSTGKWQCPSGYSENYCTWSDGAVAGELQCRKKK